jgi:hypothetical protein
MQFNLSVAVAVGFIALAGVAAETGVVMLIYLDHALTERRARCANEGRPFTREGISSEPVPWLHRIGSSPAMIAVTVIIFGRTRSTAPAMIAARRLLLGEQNRIVGNSGYVLRPPQARREKARVSAFTRANIDKILALKPRSCADILQSPGPHRRRISIRHGSRGGNDRRGGERDRLAASYRSPRLLRNSEEKLGSSLPQPKRSAAAFIASPSQRAYENPSPRRFGSPALWRAVLRSRPKRQPERPWTRPSLMAKSPDWSIARHRSCGVLAVGDLRRVGAPVEGEKFETLGSRPGITSHRARRRPTVHTPLIAA